MGKDEKWRFIEWSIQIALIVIMIINTLLAIREIWIKTYYASVRMAEIKKQLTWNASEDVEKLDHSYVADGNVEWYSHSGKHVANKQPTG